MTEAGFPFVWDHDALVEQYGSRRYVYGRWDRLFGCWTSDRHQPARRFDPPWALVDPLGRLCIGYSDANALWADPGDGDPAARPAMPLPAADGAAGYFQRYADLIPLTIRRIVGPFGRWQWVLLSMIWAEPDFTAFLRTELRAVGPGFVIACLAMNRAADLRPQERAALCRRIMHDKREQLIPGLSETRVPATAVALLAASGQELATAEACGALLAVLSDPDKAKTLARGTRLTPALIALLHRLPPWLCTGNLPTMLAAAEDLPPVGQALQTLANMVEPDDTDMQAKVYRALRQVKAVQRLPAVIKGWISRIRERPGVPPPPFPQTGSLVPLSSAALVRAEGRRMRNCIAGYLPEIIAGTSYFYRWDSAEPGCIRLRRDAGGPWRLDACLGIANASLSTANERRLRAALRTALRRPEPAPAPQAKRTRRVRPSGAQLTLPLDLPAVPRQN
jgi:hypothetical protein